MYGRIIALIDMDCFYVQVEERDNPEIKGLPAAVVTHNPWKGGGIIAVNYEARAFGVKRGMYGAEAKEKCPSINLVQVPVQRDKTDLTKFRNAGKEVVSVLREFSNCVERASVDEAFVELTDVVRARMDTLSRPIKSEDLHSTWVVGYEDSVDTEDREVLRTNGLKKWLSETYEESQDLFDSSPNEESMQTCQRQLTVAAMICEEIRHTVLKKTKFTCSAGISHNKMLAKLACGLHKPNQQTLCPLSSLPKLWAEIPIGKVRNLGGKLGDSLIKDFGCKTMADLSNLDLKTLKSRYEDKTAVWLQGLGQGVDKEPVISRHLPKSIGCGKNFMGKEALNTKEKVEKWMKVLAEELAERLEEDVSLNKRQAKTLSVSVRINGEDPHAGFSKSCPLKSIRPGSIAGTALSLIQHANKASAKQSLWIPSLKNITLSAAKFEDFACEGTTSINTLFKRIAHNPSVKNINPIGDDKEDSIVGTSRLNNFENSSIKSFFKKVEKPEQSPPQTTTDENDNLDALIMQLDAHDCEESDSDQSIELIENDVEPNRTKDSSAFKFALNKNNPSTSKTSDKNARMDRLVDFTCTSKEEIAISVKELFPDLDDVDESLLPLLPRELRKAVRDAIVAHKARQVGKRPLKGVGISKFCDEPREKDQPADTLSEKVEDCQKPESDHLDEPSEAHLPSESTSSDKVADKPGQGEEQEVECEKCGKEILTSKLNEHLDYHLAIDLREQQFAEAQNRVSKNANASKQKESHRKRNKRKTTVEVNASDKLPKIDRYFKKEF